MTRTATAVLLGMMMPAAAWAAPAELSDLQLESITAGVAASADSTAAARGAVVRTKTTSSTTAESKGRLSIAVGRTSGSASASGSGADTSSASTVSGRGDLVVGVSAAIDVSTGRRAISRSAGRIAAVERN